MRFRPAPLLVCAALALSATVTGVASASADPAAGSRAPVRAGSTGPSWYRTHHTHPARAVTVARSAPAAAPANAHLDPAALTQPATRTGRVDVAVRGRAHVVADEADALGGRVVTSAAGTSIVTMPKAHVGDLAERAGIAGVGPVNRPYALDTAPGPSQAVQASGAGSADGSGTGWHPQDPDTGVYSGITGVGVKLAIVDLGYGDDEQNAATEMAAGHLGPQTQVINEDCADRQTAYDGDAHGLAVAEIAQQQAPDTQLYLYCVDSPTGLANAVTDIVAKHIPIASSSIGWLQDARGDGTGPSGSVAASVKYARQHGVLWVNSAGNEVPQHYGGTLADADKDGYLDIGNHSETTYPYESNFYYTEPGTTADPTSLSFVLQWDEWPTAAHKVTLEAFGVQCTADLGSGGYDDCNGHDVSTQPVTVTNTIGNQPTLGLSTDSFSNSLAFPQVWEVVVKFDGSFLPGRRYDLFGEGDTYYDSDLSCDYDEATQACTYPSAATSNSVLSPANSPYALAVGAADAGIANDGDGSPSGTFEYYSSRGPTIDHRAKPDLTGWDGLSSYVNGFNDCSPGSSECGFYGTSAAAPSVAGAAALVASANPSMDAAQIQSFLERRANDGLPTNPASNSTGHGLLTLGSPTGVAAPTGSKYLPISPRRIYDSRVGIGGVKARFGAGTVRTVPLPAVPADTTAVAVNVIGVNASAKTYVSAYPTGTAFSGTSNLVLSTTDPSANVFAIVPVSDPKKPTFQLRNTAGSVDLVVTELGYYTRSASGLLETLPTGKRVLDTRNTTGNHHGKVGNGSTVTVHPSAAGVPSTATAVLVNVFAMAPTSTGYLTAGPSCTAATSTVSYRTHTRGNLTMLTLSGSHLFCVQNHGPSVDVAVDVVGYVGRSGSAYVALPSAQTIVDTRTGTGGSAGQHPSKPLGAKSSTVFQGSGLGDVPANATALFAGLVEPTNTGGTYLGVFAGSTKPATVQSTLSYSNARAVAAASVVPLSGTKYGIYSSAGSTDLAVYAFGYFAPPSG